ncbi:SH3 domain-containing protein [Paracoccus jiaweipingae]|uniref:SH3 domain-containing protein n=1 Tax=unclassified Paracoccus (in: a-proteobacteria) TaxID=2688777 RepID=UPI0037AA2468
MFRKLMCSAAIAAALTVTGASMAGAATRVETLQIPGSQTATSVFGTVGGYDTVEYGLTATKGQRLRVTMKTSNSSAYFSVYAPGDRPGQADALFTGATSGSYADLTLPADGRYTIQTYLMRNAAQADARADYTLDVHVTNDQPDASPTAATATGSGTTAADSTTSAAPATPVGDGTGKASPARGDWRVTGIDNVLNIRAEPSTGAQVVTTVQNGAILRNGGCETAEGRQWCRVTTTGTAPVSGWTVGYYLVRSDAPAQTDTAPQTSTSQSAGSVGTDSTQPATTDSAARPVGGLTTSTAPKPRPDGAASATTNSAGGHLPCSVRLGMLTRDCAYQVTRGGNGSAVVSFDKPGGGQRQIRFEQGRPLARDGMTVEQRGDLSIVNIGDERYEIPASVVFGR